MPQTDGSGLRCQLCERTCGSREDAILHLQKHVLYKKYPCEDCAQSFYSDAQREEHCASEKHHHAFKVNIDQYKEMLVNMIYKDMENLKCHDVDVVVATRAKYNAEYNSTMQAMKAAPKRQLSVTSKTTPKPTETAPASRKRRASARSSTPKPATPPPPAAPVNTPVPKKMIPKPAETPKSDERKRTVSMTNISLADPVLTPGTLSEAINLSLTTTEANAKCVVCSVKVPIDYVSRKDHVSKCHMPTAHDDSDYVQILEQRMKDSFPYLTYSDIQCQFDGCGDKFQSDSGRRKHALIHVPVQLKCPMCDIHDVEARKIDKHLRDVHRLEDGWKSIDDRNIRSEFEQKYKEQNQIVMKVNAKSFPVCIPSVYLNPRSSTKPQNPNTFASVLGEMVRDSRAFQQIPNVPPRRLSESTDSEDERERVIRKRRQERSECEQREHKNNKNAQRPSSFRVGEYSGGEGQKAVSSDDEDDVTRFAEVKDEEDFPRNEAAPSVAARQTAPAATTATKNKDAVESDQGTATSSDSEVTIIGEKRGKRRKKKMMSEEEVKKEPEEEKSGHVSTNNSWTPVDREVKKEAGVQERNNDRLNVSHDRRRKTRWDDGPAAPPPPLNYTPMPNYSSYRK